MMTIVYLILFILFFVFANLSKYEPFSTCTASDVNPRQFGNLVSHFSATMLGMKDIASLPRAFNYLYTLISLASILLCLIVSLTQEIKILVFSLSRDNSFPAFFLCHGR